MCICNYCDNKLTKEPLRIVEENVLPMEASGCESPFRNTKAQLRKQGTRRTQQQNNILIL